MGQQLGLILDDLAELALEDFGDARMKLALRFAQQEIIGRVLDERMLEAIIRLRRCALDVEKVGLHEMVEGGLNGGLAEAAVAPVSDRDHGAKKCVGKLTPEHCADLRDLARGAQPVETRGERLLQRIGGIA